MGSFMSGTPPVEVLRGRLRGFLSFLRSKLLASGADTSRLSGLRQLSDIRLRRFCVGRPRVTGLDVCALLADERTGRLDPLADQAGLVRLGHLDATLEPLGEDMAYVVEACLLLQVVGPQAMAAHLKEFVARDGPLQGPAPAVTAPAASGPAPLPAPVAKALGTVKELWSPPANVLRILDLTQAAPPAAEKVAAEIEKDPVLASLFLRLANTGAPAEGRSASIRRAAIALGFPSIRRTALSAALVLRLDGPLNADFNLHAFWAHAFRVAHAAAQVARATKLGNPDDHFTAGLFHEVGTLALVRFARPDAADPLAVGACILERWRFAPAIAAAARHHRVTPEELEELQIPREAAAVAAMCRLANESLAATAWAPVLRLPVDQIEAARRESARQAERSTLEVFAP